ncbi:MAG: gluconokinase [Chloroflexota bacterium]
MTTLVIDIGSSSVRALLVDEDLRTIGESVSRCQHAFHTAPDGTSVADPLELRGLVEEAVSGALAHPRAQHITAVGMDTFVGNLLGVDADNNPVTPLFTYADTRSADAVQHIADEIDVEAMHQRTGCPHHTAYHPGRLHWLQQSQPETVAKVARWLDFGTYLYRVWFGRAVPASYSVSSWSGLMNRHDMMWDAPLLDYLTVAPEKLPALADVYDAQQGLAAEYAQMWPALHEVPFYLPVGDGAAANIGSGGVHAGHLVLTIGTTAALRIVKKDGRGEIPQGLWEYSVDKERHLLGGATSEGGNIYEWAAGTLNLNGTDTETALAGRTPDGHGLTFLPLLAGERSPGYATRATGTLHGLRLFTTSLDILQAGMEGVALRLALIADLLTEPGTPVYGGGGAMYASDVWAQIIADALNRPLHVLDEPEVTARGVAAIVLRKFDAAASPKIAHSIHPIARHVSIYAEARQRQAELYRKMVK